MSQNFNRYSYCVNNPLRYTDENGEFLFGLFNGVKDLFVNTFIKSWPQGFNAWSDSKNWQSTAMSFKVDIGLFKGNFKQIASRFTWELPQTIAGYMFAGYNVTAYNAKSVGYYGGATVLETYSKGWGAVTLGSFINGQRGIQADPNNSLFQHEYGHYLQSQSMGWGYLSRVGIPSILDASDSETHDFHPVEQDANYRAFKYFNKNVEGFYKSREDKDLNYGWDFTKNPLDPNNTKLRGQYWDYNNSSDMASLKNLKIGTSFGDYAGWHFSLIGSFCVGMYNANKYKNY